MNEEEISKRKPLLKRWWLWVVMVIIALIVFAFIADVRREIRNIEINGIPVGAFEEEASHGTITQRQNQQGASPVSTDDPSIGAPLEDARIVIVGFEDFECPFCQLSFPIIREITTQYSDRVHFIYRDFPLSQIHSRAVAAANAGECAHEQGRFWPYHDKLFVNQSDFSDTALVKYAREVGMPNIAQFQQCVISGKHVSEVQTDFDEGVALGVTGTPTWFINGHRVGGVIPLEVWKQIIESEV